MPTAPTAFVALDRPSRGSLRPPARRGAIVALVAVLLVVIFILGAMAINVAYLELCNAELRTATDSAARAAARTLAQTGSESQARAAAQQAAAANSVAGSPLTLAAADIQFGRSTRPSITSRYGFTPRTSFDPPANSVAVIGRRTQGSASGPIQLFFGNLLGVSTANQDRSAVATQAEMDILFVLDRSGSMAFTPAESVNIIPAAADLNGNGAWDPGEWNYGDPPPIPGDARWEAVLGSMYDFLVRLTATPGAERVAVVIFNHEAMTVVDFTGNYGGLMTTIDQVSPMGATGIGNAIAEGTTRFATSGQHRPWASKVMVVLTDGINNTGQDPLAAAQLARNAGITVHSISFTSEASTGTMEAVSQIGGGLYCSALNATQLDAAFKKIFDSLPVLLVE